MHLHLMAANYHHKIYMADFSNLIVPTKKKKKKQRVIVTFTVDLISISRRQMIILELCLRESLELCINTVSKVFVALLYCFRAQTGPTTWHMVSFSCCVVCILEYYCFVNAASGKKETKWMDEIKIQSRDCWRLFITVLVMNVRYFKRQLVIL